MDEILKSFGLGPYTGLVVEAADDTSDFLNQVINRVIDSSEIVVNQAAVEHEAPRVEAELRKGLEEGKVSVGAFCYVNGITEDKLPEYCKANLVRTAAENRVIEEIASAEGIEVTPEDISAYMREYRTQYAKVLLDDPEFGENELRDAIRVRKVLGFLKDNNTWKPRAEG